MKKRGRYGAILAALAAISLLLSACNTAAPDMDTGVWPDAPETEGTGLQTAAENAHLLLTVDYDTGDFTLTDKRSGRVYRSIPEGADIDGLASEETRNALRSAVQITMADTQNNTYTLNSYTDAVESGQVSVTSIPNGVRILYRLGKEPGRNLVPPVIPAARMEEFIIPSLESERDGRRMLTFFSRYDLSEAVDEETKAQWLTDYPGLKEGPLYVFGGAQDNDMEWLTGLLEEAGYTQSMYEEDAALSAVEGQESRSTPWAALPLEILLEDESLVVRIPADSLAYNVDFIPYQVAVLPFFGAGLDGADGSLFLPDGSGALVGFNKGGEKKTLVTESVLYGPDGGQEQKASPVREQVYRAPVFGIQQDGAALFGIVEQGDANCVLHTELSGIIHSYNTVYPILRFKNQGTFQLGEAEREETDLVVYEKQTYTGAYVLRYFPLAEEEANWAGMARCYRAYLIGRGLLPESGGSDTVPLFVDTCGILERETQILGVSVKQKTPLTTFQQAEKMVDWLHGAGVQRILLRYVGYGSGGLQAGIADRLSPEGKLGGEKGLRALGERLNAQGDRVYLEADFAYAADRWMDGFSPNSDAVKMLDRRIGVWRRTDYATASLLDDGYRYVVTPRRYEKDIAGFLADLDSYGGIGVSAGSLGAHLNADYSQDNGVTRSAAMRTVIQGLDSIAAKAPLMIAGGNAYGLAGAAAVVDLPMTSSRLNIAEEEVPFLQMVLHGSLDYTGGAVNLSADFTETVLQTVAFGGSLRFMLNAENTAYLKDSVFSDYYSSRFDDWREDAAALYSRVAAVLGETVGQPMTGYVRQGAVSITSYGDRKVYVNFSDEEQTVDGATIPPRDFLSR